MTPLASSDEQAALAEAERLVQPDVAGTERLIELLSHRSWTVRRAAVAALSRGSTESLARSVAALIEQRSSEPVVAGLVDALSGASPDADPLIRALLLIRARRCLVTPSRSSGGGAIASRRRG